MVSFRRSSLNSSFQWCFQPKKTQPCASKKKGFAGSYLSCFTGCDSQLVRGDYTGSTSLWTNQTPDQDERSTELARKDANICFGRRMALAQYIVLWPHAAGLCEDPPSMGWQACPKNDETSSPNTKLPQPTGVSWTSSSKIIQGNSSFRAVPSPNYHQLPRNEISLAFSLSFAPWNLTMIHPRYWIH